MPKSKVQMKDGDHSLIKIVKVLNRRLNTSKVVIPAKAGIQADTGCRIKPGMTEVVPLIAGLIPSFEL